MKQVSHTVWPLLVVAVMSAGCRGTTHVPAVPAAPPVAASLVVDTETVSLPLSFSAELYVERDAAIAARSSGVVDSLLVDLGSRVEAGQLLARIESVDQTIGLAKVEAALEQSERDVARARALAKVRGITAADSEQAEFQHRDALIEVSRARRALELTRITAPFAGVVTARYIRPHRLVTIGDTLFRIAEPEPLLARIRIPESPAALVKDGAKARVDGGTAGSTTATVFKVAPVIDPGSGTREVIVRLEHTSHLLPGTAVTIRLGSERRSVLSIPREAVSSGGYVLVIDGARTELRAVVLGADLGRGRVEVISGLRAGEHLARPDR